ncbi:hypothetical protein HanXRQr2_Chr14g0646451 [Helianthus annuus]|uniref:Uncharacterized protein n=1 Tax=Helianthus annuus TaxID=4232 RepID=A0A251SI85_HELAN|nr:hypothetical protein HanXRQr2_Chr14g0646451 [Helianthus annuus]
MLLFICIFGGTLFTPYNFLIYLKVVVSRGERKDNDKSIKKYYLIEKERENVVFFSVI